VTIPIAHVDEFYNEVVSKLQGHIKQSVMDKQDGEVRWRDFRMEDPFGFYLRFTELIDWDNKLTTLNMKKIRVLVVHGGMTFKNEKDYLHYLRTKKVSTEKRIYWTGDYLEKSLGKGFEIIVPRMPLQDNAKYRDWKIFFERYIPFLGRHFV